jgi:hypothetical protein
MTEIDINKLSKQYGMARFHKEPKSHFEARVKSGVSHWRKSKDGTVK